MSAAAPPPRPAFPDQEAYARRFFAEAARHLEDARILHAHGRYSAAITSTMKGAELGLKAVLILAGTMGWWDELLRTHKPLLEIQTHPVLKHICQELHRHDAKIIADVTAMEKLAPSRQDTKSLSFESQANTEYPFFYLRPSAGSMPDSAHLVSPSEYFTEPESRTHFRASRALLAAGQAVYSQIGAWGVVLPAPL